MELTNPIILNETGIRMAEALEKQAALLQVMASEKAQTFFTNVKEVARLVRSGLANKYFNIGDQLIIPWTDVATGTTYDVPHNILSFSDVTLKTGEVVPGMYLQWHYATPYSVQFDNYEAFYYCEEQLPAGTYYITVGTNWGTYCKLNESYYFTLTQPVPAGGQLCGFYRMPDQAPSNWRVYSYESATALDPIETVSVTVGANGTSLGTLTFAGDGTLNSLQRVAYGYNRWSHSGARQLLNSLDGVGEWWKPQNKFDRAPDQLKTIAGFMSGYDEEFLSCIQPVKVTTALNTVTDAADGTQEDTYDTFFSLSLEEIYTQPQAPGVEGVAFDWWKRALELTEPSKWHPSTYDAYKIFAINAKTSPQYVRLRSAYRGHACSTWNLYSGGYVYNGSAFSAYRQQPVCVIA